MQRDIKKLGFHPWVRKISPGGSRGYLLQYSCLENTLDRGAWWATVHRVEESQTQLKRLSMHTRMLCTFLPTAGFFEILLLKLKWINYYFTYYGLIINYHKLNSLK